MNAETELGVELMESIESLGANFKVLIGFCSYNIATFELKRFQHWGFHLDLFTLGDLMASQAGHGNA